MGVQKPASLGGGSTTSTISYGISFLAGSRYRSGRVIHSVFALQADRVLDHCILLSSPIGRLRQCPAKSSWALGDRYTCYWRIDCRSHGEIWHSENQGSRHPGSDGSGSGEP